MTKLENVLSEFNNQELKDFATNQIELGKIKVVDEISTTDFEKFFDINVEDLKNDYQGNLSAYLEDWENDLNQYANFNEFYVDMVDTFEVFNPKLVELVENSSYATIDYDEFVADEIKNSQIAILELSTNKFYFMNI